MSSNSMNMSLLSQKALFFAGSSYLLDKFALKEQNEMRSILFAVSGASACFIADALGNYIPKNLSGNVMEGSVIEERIMEIGLISGSAYLTNRYIIGADNPNQGLIEKIGVLVASDLISTYAVDYLNGRALTFL